MQLLAIYLGLVSLMASALAITITSPSPSSYWVQFTSNTISWSYSTSDPSTVSLRIINSNSTLLNGAFSIAEYIQASLESFTITNVTLIVAEGYAVQMVNSTNNTQVYATSGTFSVKPNGTTPAPLTGVPGAPGNSAGVNSSSGSSGMNGNNHTSTNVQGSSFNNSSAGTNARSSAVTTRIPVVLAGLGMAFALIQSVTL